jgi:hypothetical protein
MALNGLAVVVVALTAFVVAVLGCHLGLGEELEGADRLGMVMEGLRIEHVKGDFLKVGSCGLANVCHASLLHLDGHSAQVFAHKDGEVDRYVKDLLRVKKKGVNPLKLPELVKEEIDGTGELGALFLNLADLTVVFLVELNVAGDKVWDLGGCIFVHVNILGKIVNGLLKLSVTDPLFGKKLNRPFGFDAGAPINIILPGAVVLQGSLRSDLRVVVLVKALVDDTLQPIYPAAKEEDNFILGVKRGRG